MQFLFCIDSIDDQEVSYFWYIILLGRQQLSIIKILLESKSRRKYITLFLCISPMGVTKYRRVPILVLKLHKKMVATGQATS